MFNMRVRPLLLSFLFGSSFAISTVPKEMELEEQKWREIASTQMPDFSDITYQLVSYEGDKEALGDQYLRLAIAKDKDSLVAMHEQLLSPSPKGAVSKPHRSGPHFMVYETQVEQEGEALPEFIAISAIQHNDRQGVFAAFQYSIKPNCPRCVKEAQTWKERLEHLSIDDAGKFVFADGEYLGVFGIDDLHFSSPDERGYIRKVLEDYYAYVISGVVGGGSLLVKIFWYGGKVVGGAAGYTGPCGKSLGMCQCGNNMVN